MAATEIASAVGVAPPATEDTLRDRLRAMLARLSDQQKILLMVSAAAVVALLAVSVLWLRQEEYRILFSNLSERDGGAIIAALEQQNIPYKFGPGGSSLLIPGDRVYDTRLRLAAQGLPKGGNVGFELMENQKFGITQFAEQVNFQRALEGELAKTIGSIAVVQEARVHLAIPKPTVFIREELKPSASVFLSLYPGRALDPLQISGIQNLVAASVSSLLPAKVSVIDQNGVLLSETKNKLLEAGLDPTQIKYVQEIEAAAIKRIEDILLPVVGKGNARVQVAADIDFSQSEQTAETHRPNVTPPDIAIRSQQTSESSTRMSSAQGVPGALTNQPPVPATAPIVQPPGQGEAASAEPPLNMRKDQTTNYEVDRTVRYTKHSVGIIRRLSAAVVINYRKDARGVFRALPDPEIKQIESLVRDAMGFTTERGDTVSVANASFSAVNAEAALPFWKNPESLPIIRDMFKYFLIAVVVIFLIFKVIRPILRVMLNEPEPESAAKGDAASAAAIADKGGEAAAENGQAADSEDLNARLPGEDVLFSERVVTEYDQLLNQARTVALRDPKAIADIIKDWTDSHANT